jgi:hypothetical protein
LVATNLIAMPQLTLQEILAQLPEINPNRRYWLVRTQGGEYYNAFVKGGYVAIGYDKITLSDIKAGNTKNDTGVKILSAIISKKYKQDEEGRPTHSASQLIKFAYTIKKGDIVLIPSENSSEITFGEVTDNHAYLARGVQLVNCPFKKRKKVKWLKKVYRDSLDPNLYKLMFSHHTISDGDSYAQYIDAMLDSFFVKNKQAHIVIGVQSKKDINARELFEMGLYSLELLDDFCQQESLPYNGNDVSVKIELQSPGSIELVGWTVASIVLVGLIIVGLAGGGFGYKDSKGTQVALKSDGIIERMRKYLNSKGKRDNMKKLLKDHLENLDIKDPEDLIKVLKQIQDNQTKAKEKPKLTDGEEKKNEKD